jgi:SPP1 gp7 family putative phage head morphogenesis protein
LFEQQRQDVINRIDSTKAIKRPQNINDMLFDIEEYTELFEEAGKPYYIASIMEVGNDVLNELIQGVRINIDQKPVVNFIDKFTRKYAKATNETTVALLRDSLQQGIDAGEAIPDLAKRVNEIMQDAIENRATMIARSETVRASNFGAEEAMRQSGVVESKEWVVAIDERTCDICMEMDGMVVGLGEIFAEDSYSDIAAPPRHVNCRCTIVPVVSED